MWNITNVMVKVNLVLSFFFIKHLVQEDVYGIRGIAPSILNLDSWTEVRS
jgi:hypothetical protein